MSTMELEAQKSGIIRQLLNIESKETLGKLEKYMQKMMRRSQEKEALPIAPAMNVTKAEFDSQLQEAVNDDNFATDEEVSQFYERWSCAK